MNEQYYNADPHTPSRPVQAIWRDAGREYAFTSDSGVFSRGRIDYGSILLVQALPPLRGRVLDLGCGSGFIGIAAALRNPGLQVALCDINARAVALAQANAAAHGIPADVRQGDGYAAVQGRFDAILTNPPVRAGKQVYYPWLQRAPEYLNAGGSLYVVLRKQQGAQSARKLLQDTFGACAIIAHSAGYQVLRADRPAAQ